MAAPRNALRLLGLILAVIGTASSAVAQAAADRPVPLAGLDLYLPGPVGTARPGRIALGRRLFFDPVLSRDSTISCASCHQPDRAFTDGRPRAEGIGGRLGRRNTPTLLNRGYGTAFSWDGRGRTLETQALQAIQDRSEMDHRLDAATDRLARLPGYVRAFREALGRRPSGEAIGEALAGYLRSIRAGSSPFDRFAAGDSTALSPLERRGLALFQGPARCDRCHSGSLLSDETFHNTGVGWRGGESSDAGRLEVTGRPGDRGAFKTPSLREVGRTAPYMHDGSLASLEEVIEFYARGGNSNPNLDPEIRPLRLSVGDRQALAALLRALSGSVREGEPPNEP